MDNILDKSLDEIIGDSSDSRRSTRGPRGSRGPRGPRSSYRSDRRDDRDRPPRRDQADRGDHRRKNNFRERDIEGERSFKPRQTRIQRLSHGNPYIKISNLHYDLTSDDLKKLLETVGEVQFVEVEFDHSNRSIGVAYAGFVNYEEDNKKAVQEFDGRTALGQTIDVEEIKPLNILARSDRPTERRERRPRGDVYVPAGDNKEGGPREGRPPRRGRANAEDLDKELEEYMNRGNQTESAPASAEGEASAPVPGQEDVAEEDRMED